MRKLKARTLSLPLFLFAVCATFQNCDAGFKYDESGGSVSSSSTGDLTGVFGVQLYAPGGLSPLASSTSMDVNQPYEVRASGTSGLALSWAVDSTVTTANCVLSSLTTGTKYQLKCSSAGNVTVNVTAVDGSGGMTMASIVHVVGSVSGTPTPVSSDPNVVNFTVAAGTAGSPWNNASNPIQVFVGQTLKVYNADSVPHRIHAGGMPFDHQSTDNNGAGQTASIAVTAAHSGTATDLYDHNTGTSAIIYIQSTDGEAAYKKSTGTGSCASCHGGTTATSTKRGASYTSITNAIANQSQMRGISLSVQELKAIVYLLNK